MRVQRRWLGVGRGGRALAFSVAIGTLAAACNGLGYNQDAPRSGDVFDKVRQLDLFPRQHQPADVGRTGSGGGPRPASYFGTGTGTGTERVVGAQRASSGEGYELNFENTPVTTVAKVILGDILGVGYTIDARVQGTVTLASGRPVAKSDILYVLESALRMSNVTLAREARGSYRLLPAQEAIGTGGVDNSGQEAGFGITVIPLQYVSAPTLLKLLDSFATKPGTVRADPGRNLIVIQGSGTERRTAIDIVMNFDADWMRGQSVGIYPVRNSTPEPIIAELERIMDLGEGGLSQSVVKLQPIARQNAILVVSRKPELLRAAQTWIARLDNADAATTGVKVYRVRYGDARLLAALLTDIFTGRGAGGPLDATSNVLAPGAGMITSSSVGGSRLEGTPQAQTSLLSPRQQTAATVAGVIDQRFAPFTPGPGAGPSISTTTTTVGPGFGPGVGAGGGQGAAGILPGVRITADVANNALLIYSNQEHYRIIERTLRQLDRPQLQVSIDATIAEITLNDDLSYGVQVFLKSRDVGLGVDKGSVFNSATATTAAISRILPGFNFLAGAEASPKVILDALQNVTDVKVLSTPSVVVLDNQVATLQVGDQVPIATRSAVAVDVPLAPVVNAIDYRPTGVILRVVPRINVNGNVMLDVEQEISHVARNTPVGSVTPTISQRRVRSSIAVASGQTVLLAGLISEREDASKAGIPGLSQIPAIGAVFGRQGMRKERTELIIFIRPQIIRDSVDAARVAEELRSKLRGQFGSVDPPRGSPPPPLPPLPPPPRAPVAVQ
jgi:general secretion pathway protein D